MENQKKYKDYGEVDFEDHEIEQAEERYDNLKKEDEEMTKMRRCPRGTRRSKSGKTCRKPNVKRSRSYSKRIKR